MTVSWIWLPLTTSLAPHYSCTSPMDCISHHSLHSHIPIHHYTNHTAVTNHSLTLIVSPHLHLIHTHTYKQHTSMQTLQSLVLAPADISECYSSCYLLSLCLTPDCPTLELWTCACDPDFCLVLFTSLPCLWYSCFCPLTFACLILSIKQLTAHGSTRLWPVIKDCHIFLPNSIVFCHWSCAVWYPYTKEMCDKHFTKYCGWCQLTCSVIF